MKKKWFVYLVITVVLILLTGQVALAQDGGQPKGDDDASQAPIVPEQAGIVVPGAIPVQGRLTDASGRALNGDYSLTFALYDVETGGIALCSQGRTVPVTNGLFNSYLDNCYNKISGQKVWMGVKVGSDPEMTPRQVIYPVPYAVTLKPGALISGTIDGILTIEGTGGAGGTLDYDGLSVYAAGGGEAVSAYTENGIGVYSTSDTSVAIEGIALNTVDSVAAVVGCVTTSGPECTDYSNNNPAGVVGFSNRGDGVQANSSNVGARGLYAANSAGGIALGAYSNSVTSASHLYPTLYLVQGNTEGDFVVGANSFFGTRYWRVDRTGKGFFNGNIQASGADFAEQIAVDGNEAAYEPGDVMVISPDTDRVVELSTGAYDTAVIGVYSTKPAVLAGAEDTDDPLSGVPVAIVGIVPCKVSAENGPIHPGDLLVTASRAGYAMRAGANPPQGTVLGKAMQSLESGIGTIQILVTLQ